MKDSRARFEALAVFLFILTLFVGVGPDFGPYWDSWFYNDHAIRWSAWFASWVRESPAPPLAEWRWYFPEEPRHPPLLEWGGGLSHLLFHRVLGGLGSCRLVVEASTALWLGAGYYFLRVRLGRGAALLGAALFLGSPRSFLHGVLYAVDGLVAAVYGLVLLSFLYWDRGRLGKALVGVALFIGFLTKLQALYLVPLLVGWVCLLNLKDGTDGSSRRVSLSADLGRAIPVVAAAGAVTFAVWPAMWLDFPKGIRDYVQFITEHGNLPVLYFDRLFKGWERPPWHYPWVFTALALPLTATVPVLARGIRMVNSFSRAPSPAERLSGGGRLDRFRGGLGKAEALLWAGAALPLVTSSLPQAPKYDGVRLLLPAYGPLYLLAAAEISSWLGTLRRRLKGRVKPRVWGLAAAGTAVLLLTPTLRIHPFNLVYYSPLVGGTAGARKAGFDLEYLGVSMHRLNPTLQRVATGRDILLLAGCNAVVGTEDREGWPSIPKGMFVADFKLIREIDYRGRQVFAILSSRYSDLGPEAHLVLERLEPLDTVEYRGERLFSLHRIAPEFVASLPKELAPKTEEAPEP